MWIIDRGTSHDHLIILDDATMALARLDPASDVGLFAFSAKNQHISYRDTCQ
jgi:hypothetical protein